MRPVPLFAAAVMAPGLAWADGPGPAFAPPTMPPSFGPAMSLPLGGGASLRAGGEWLAVGVGWRLKSDDGRLAVGLAGGMAAPEGASIRPGAAVSLTVIIRLP